MSRFSVLACSLAAAMLVSSVGVAQKEAGTAAKKEKKFRAVCPVSGKKAAKENFVAHREAKLYFCCENCPKAFERDSAKFEVKANQQLAVTRQFVQKKCPLSGGKLNPETAVKVGTTKLAFCCNNCKGKFEGETDKDKQLAMVFGKEAFEKGYAKKAPKKKKAE